jgi:hypothetical protein
MMLGSGTTLAFQPLAWVGRLLAGHFDEAFASESKMESNRRAGIEKFLCGNGLLQSSIPPAPARLCSHVPCKMARRIEIQHFAIEHRQQLHVSGLGELSRRFHQRRRRIVRRDVRAHDANDHLCVSFRHDDAGLTEYDPRRHVHDGRLAISFRHRREQGVHVGHRDPFQILCLSNQFRHLLVGVVLVFEMNVIALVQQIAEREILGISMGRGSSGSGTITALQASPSEQSVHKGFTAQGEGYNYR